MQRLKTRAQYQAVLAGATVSRTAHFVLHRTGLDAQPPESVVPASPSMPTAAATHAQAPVLERSAPMQRPGPGSSGSAALFAVDAPWVGALIPKRWARRAVTRNAIRRQIYAVSSDPACPLGRAAHVVRLRSAFDQKIYPSASSDALKLAVRGELRQLFARAQR